MLVLQVGRKGAIEGDGEEGGEGSYEGVGVGG